MRLLLLVSVLCSLLAAPGAPAQAQAPSRLETIKARKSMSCAAYPRPGLALFARDAWRGLYVELCRAVAVAIFGESAEIEFHSLDLPQELEALRKGEIDLSFLSASEISRGKLADAVSPGPPVFYEWHALMVEERSPAQTPEDLADALICLHQGHTAHLGLEERLAQKKLSFTRFGFEEDVEFLDTYNVQRCKAAVAEATELALMRLNGGVNKIRSRILNEPLWVFPILAVTPRADAQWSAVVDWIVHFVQAAERKESPWRSGGAKALAIKAEDLPLAAGWREAVLSAVGDYSAIYARTLGENSAFKLPRGVNAPWSAGGLSAPPVSD